MLRFILVISLLMNFSVLLSAGYFYYKQSAYRASPFCQQPLKNNYLIESISLRPEQRETIKVKMSSFHANIDAARKEVLAKRIELLALMQSDSPDQKIIDNKIADIGRMQGNIQKMAAAHILEVKNQLDKDQRDKFFGLLQDVMGRGQMRSPW